MSDIVTLIEPLQRAQAIRHSPPIVCVADVLTQMARAKYTGASTVHWHEGRITVLELPNPLTIKVLG